MDTRSKLVDGELVLENDIAYYNGEAMRPPQQHWTAAKKLELLDTHPLFTNRCPQCEMPYPSDYKPLAHWDCPYCDWKDDSV
ncbi:MULTISPECIES: hypothetical protein [Aerosakkonema]|uniref:hypothetical protein n=1 Tax=Aerosakkonema TaxID=1246629 RepID=UPI0035B8E3EA